VNEHDPNYVARRADWRFLLPSRAPRTAVSFADASLAASVASVARIYKEALGKADLAVVSDPDADTLRRAFAALRPGGGCYGEWHNAVRGFPKRVRTELEAAGFVDVACYWPWPPPNRDSPRLWLPLESETALQHFLSTRPTAFTRARRMRQRALASLWRAGSRLRVLRPVCVVARKPGWTDGPAGLLATVRDRWGTFGSGAEPRSLSCLMLAGGAKTVNKLVALIFADEQRQPALAVKIARVPESRAALAREAENLEALRADSPDGLPGVPSVLFLEQGDLTMLGETFLGGRPLTTVLKGNRYPQVAAQVAEWLIALASHREPVARDRWWPRLVEQPVAEFERAFASVFHERELRTLRELLGSLGDLPLVPEQRDCAPWNLLLADSGDLVVHDWESAELQGLPFMDLTYFLTHAAFVLDRAWKSRSFGESYRASRDEATLTGKVRAECERRYLEQLGIDCGVTRALTALTWVVHSQSEYARISSDLEPHPAALGSSVFLALLREHLEGSGQR
jgi:hypothetical protein